MKGFYIDKKVYLYSPRLRKVLEQDSHANSRAIKREAGSIVFGIEIIFSIVVEEMLKVRNWLYDISS